ncbi:MAG: hypothetical protein IJP31_05710 [Lachnospiraceae bacterium]|nr:hypothetical protein [Lachnospiraceae bacterium]
MEKRKIPGFGCFLIILFLLWFWGSLAGEPELSMSDGIVGKETGRIGKAEEVRARMKILEKRQKCVQQIYEEMGEGDWTRVYLGDIMKWEKDRFQENYESWLKLDLTKDGVDELIFVYDLSSWKEEGLNKNKAIYLILSEHQGRMEPVFMYEGETGKAFLLTDDGRIIYQVQGENRLSRYASLSFTPCELGTEGITQTGGTLSAVIFYEDGLYSKEDKEQLKEWYPDTYGKYGAGLYCFWSEKQIKENGIKHIIKEKNRIEKEEFLIQYRKIAGENLFYHYPGWTGVFADEPWYYSLEVDQEHGYVPVYAGIIRNRQINLDPETGTFGLIYVDEDDIPELVLGKNGWWLELYTYVEGQGVKRVDSFDYGIGGRGPGEYIPGKNLIRIQDSDLGGDITYTYVSRIGGGGYTLIEALLDEKGEPDGFGNEPEGELSWHYYLETEGSPSWETSPQISEEKYDQLLRDEEFISMVPEKSYEEVLNELYRPILEAAGLDREIYGLEKWQGRYLLTSGSQIELLSELIAADGELEPGVKAAEAGYLLCRNMRVKDWVKLGSKKSPFTGTILGNGYTIEGFDFSIETGGSLTSLVKELNITERFYTDQNAASREEIEYIFGEEGKAVLKKLLDQKGGKLRLVNLQELEEGVDSCIFSLEDDDELHVFIGGYRNGEKLSFQHFTFSSISYYSGYYLTVAEIDGDGQEDLLVYEGVISGSGGTWMALHGLVWNEETKQYEPFPLPDRISHVELQENRLLKVWRLGMDEEGIDVWQLENGEYVLTQQLLLTMETLQTEGKTEYIFQLSYYEDGSLVRVHKLPAGEDAYEAAGRLYPELDYWRRG